MHSLEAGSAWKHDSIYPCPVPHQYGPILVHGYPVKCFACILLRGANFADKSTLLYQLRAIRSTSHAFVPCAPDILYLPPDILGNIFIFLLLQESRVGHCPAPFFPPASTIFFMDCPWTYTISCLWQASKLTIVFQRKSISMAFLGVA